MHAVVGNCIASANAPPYPPPSEREMHRGSNADHLRLQAGTARRTPIRISGVKNINSQEPILVFAVAIGVSEVRGHPAGQPPRRRKGWTGSNFPQTATGTWFWLGNMHWPQLFSERWRFFEMGASLPKAEGRPITASDELRNSGSQSKPVGPRRFKAGPEKKLPAQQ